MGLQVSVAVRSLSKRADLSPAGWRSNSTLAMLQSTNSPLTEFAISQGCGRSGSAALPASAA